MVPRGVKRVGPLPFRAKCRLSAAPHHVLGHPNPFIDREATMRALTVLAAILFALATLPASAQERQTTARSDAQKKEDKEVDDAYRHATRGGPNAATKVDPWSRVRPADADKKPK
jgi:hypothetical protein